MARRSAVPQWTEPSGGGRRFFKTKLAGLVLGIGAVALWAKTHPMSQAGYIISALLAVGVVSLLVHHYRQGQLRSVLPLVLMALALFAVLTNGPGSQFLTPNPPAAHGKQATARAKPQPARAGDKPTDLLGGVVAACDSFAPCKSVRGFLTTQTDTARQGLGLLLGRKAR
jgi:hypothetical protein